MASGRGTAYCDEELRIAEAFWDPHEYLPDTGVVWNACVGSGYIPLALNAADPASPTPAELSAGGPACLGAVAGAGCGRPEAQGCSVDPTQGVDRECTRNECIPQ